MEFDLADRIRSRMDELHTNPSRVALDAGLGRSSVRDIILRRAENPRLDTLRKLTGPLKCTLDYLTGASDDPEKEGVHQHLWWMDAQGIGYTEKAEAGVYREPLPASPVDPNLGSIPASSAHIQIPDPRLASWSYSLVEVGDNSLNGLHIVRGDVATIASPRGEQRIPLNHGLLVLVRRQLFSHEAEEISIRQIDITDGQVRLISRSTDPFRPIELLRSDVHAERKPLVNRYAAEVGVIEIRGVIVRITRQIPISDELMDFSYSLR